MPYNQSSNAPQPNFNPCPVCTESAVFVSESTGGLDTIDCSRCGDFYIPRAIRDRFSAGAVSTQRAVVSHFIRKLYMADDLQRVFITVDLLQEFLQRKLPTAAEAMDSTLLWLTDKADGRPGAAVTFKFTDPEFLATVGLVDRTELKWIIDSLSSQGVVTYGTSGDVVHTVPTPKGWQHAEELRRAHVASRYAFFARRFENPTLSRVVDDCIRPAVERTGFELRLATQRAGLIDATIEDEIRRCRFLIADLSDDNAGAYWEAGFAEGLGKPVIYLCCAKDLKEPTKKKETHFDTNHRHTVRWDPEPATFDDTAKLLKAVIRNTLLGDAKQED